MHISKLIENENSTYIFNNDNYPGKIQKHLFPTKIENYKMLYSYLNNNDYYNTDDNQEDLISNCSSIHKDIGKLYQEEEYIQDNSFIDYNNDNNISIIVENHINDNIESKKSSYFSDYMPDINIINNKSKNTTSINVHKSNHDNIKDLSKTEIIKKLNNENSELKKKVKSMVRSDNLNELMKNLNMSGNEIINKKYVIINYARNIGITIPLSDFEILDLTEIEDMYNIIENIKIKKNSYDISNTIIKLIFTCIEKFLVETLHFNLFIDISQGITEDYIESKCKTTKNFISTNISVPEYPFIDILLQIVYKIIGNYVFNNKHLNV
ncbi:viral membrane formation (Cop-A11R) [Choristoneura biennis entomopoxvirus]|uniref:Viral membrane formation (Cop-A11R) n=1 Tax=Choristoneura biennis entomopoxvirus TaxID=10288 RepID=A0A916P122_CBEPV|nr:viral membrane formation (Cop-A11R) [Choristoneura biennis entomopoxvirus]CCU55756.1 viral membrane formation (Cop-A11R) [Choristoneura biennis entomopoxvirus]